MTSLGYNERAWAIDVVVAVNDYAQTKRLAIIRAGGEATLRGGADERLFPDVILFGDSEKERVRHGWELKFPDTPIHNSELLDNAAKKARLLGVSSFLVWNVNEAALYARVDDDDGFEPIHTWPSLGVTRRNEVLSSEVLWRSRLHDILDTLNEYFRSGRLKSASPTDVLQDRFLADFLGRLVSGTGTALQAAVASSASRTRRLRRWWAENAIEYGASRSMSPFPHLSVVVLTSWTNRFLFCHYLRHFYDVAATVDQICEDCSIEHAEKIFGEVSAQCDFMQILSAHPFSEYIGETSWRSLVQFNEFLGRLRLDKLPHDQLAYVLERMLVYSRRKAAGQFVTPPQLARLLVELTMEERAASVLDPCCGSGSIVRAAYEAKMRSGFTVREAMSTVWASDKFHFPLQLCTLALAHRDALGQILRVFSLDVFRLSHGLPVNLVEPDGGREVTTTLAPPATIVSNLPFVRAEDYRAFNKLAGPTANASTLSRRADLYAWILLHLADIVPATGRIGIIVANSWLGTEWGMDLRRQLRKKFHIETVIVSGAGRWFAETKVVTTILVLARRRPPNLSTRFVTTLKPIHDWTSDTSDRLTDDLDRSEAVETPDYVIYHHSQDLIRIVEESLHGYTALFAECDWLPETIERLAPIKRFFDVRRGERRGWNQMFYPVQDHDIEVEYLAPVLRSSTTVRGLVAAPDGAAFCCSETLDEIERRGHRGARAWIRRFERRRNKKGVPLPEVLSRPGHFWYEMKAERQADFVTSVNPGDRLFVARMTKRSFVDQRLIALTARTPDVDHHLMHALMNTTLTKFLIEATGFGRGMSVLDLSKDRIATVLRIPDPARIGQGDRDRIVEAFQPLVARGVQTVPDDLADDDVRRLDEAVLRAVGLIRFEDSIRKSLLALYRIRKAARP